MGLHHEFRVYFKEEKKNGYFRFVVNIPIGYRTVCSKDYSEDRGVFDNHIRTFLNTSTYESSDSYHSKLVAFETAVKLLNKWFSIISAEMQANGITYNFSNVITDFKLIEKDNNPPIFCLNSDKFHGSLGEDFGDQLERLLDQWDDDHRSNIN